jgi:hypothetical protein
MANDFLNEAKGTQRSKVQNIVGHTKNYRHPTDKASDNYEYYQNAELDPLTMPTRDKVGP